MFKIEHLDILLGMNEFHHHTKDFYLLIDIHIKYEKTWCSKQKLHCINVEMMLCGDIGNLLG